MNQSHKILMPLEPPPGGWERLRARRNSANHFAPSWWALASEPTEIRMQLTGGRLVGQSSQGEDPQILDNGRTDSLPSADANVRSYFVEPTGSTPAKTK